MGIGSSVLLESIRGSRRDANESTGTGKVCGVLLWQQENLDG